MPRPLLPATLRLCRGSADEAVAAQPACCRRNANLSEQPVRAACAAIWSITVASAMRLRRSSKPRLPLRIADHQSAFQHGRRRGEAIDQLAVEVPRIAATSRGKALGCWRARRSAGCRPVISHRFVLHQAVEVGAIQRAGGAGPDGRGEDRGKISAGVAPQNSSGRQPSRRAGQPGQQRSARGPKRSLMRAGASARPCRIWPAARAAAALASASP
jgi:hypothetical protein